MDDEYNESNPEESESVEFFKNGIEQLGNGVKAGYNSAKDAITKKEQDLKGINGISALKKRNNKNPKNNEKKSKNGSEEPKKEAKETGKKEQQKSTTEKEKNKKKKGNTNAEKKSKAAKNANVPKSKVGLVLKILKDNPWLILIGLMFTLLPIILLVILIAAITGGTNSGGGANGLESYASLANSNAACVLEKPIANYHEVVSLFSWYIDESLTDTAENDTTSNAKTSPVASYGVTISAEKGTEIYSSQDGIITEVGDSDKLGHYIIVTLEHESNVTSVITYAHLCSLKEEQEKLALDSNYVSPCVNLEETENTYVEGTEISYGSVIGYTSSENFYYEVKINGKYKSTNNLFGYENPSNECDPNSTTNLDRSTAISNGCGNLKEIEENLEEICENLVDSYGVGDKEAFINCINGEYEKWQNDSYSGHVESVNKYCVEGAGSVNGCQWCASFVAWCLKQTDMFNGIGFTGRPHIAYAEGLRHATNGQAYGRDGYTPQVGDFIFFDWSGHGTEASGADHVEVVIGVENGYVITLGGNTGSGATTYTRDIKTHRFPLTSNFIIGYFNW